MKNMKIFFVLIALMAINSLVYSQNGNAVISEVQVYDLGDGTGVLEVRISGNLASAITSASFTVSGDGIPGGNYASILSGGRPVNLPGYDEVIIAGGFLLNPAVGNQPRFVDVAVSAPGADTFSARRLIRFPTTVVNQGR